MPPSGDELILKLLSQSVARLESGDRKRKQKEEEVTFLKSGKKVKRGETENANSKTVMKESLIVCRHLEEVSSHLAEEFSTLHTFPRVLNYLKEVSPELAEDLISVKRTHRQSVKLSEDLPELQKTCKVSDKGKPINKKTGITPKKFTPLEDKVINTAVEEAGEGPIDTVSLAKKLNRHRDSVRNRIKTLQRTGGVIKKTQFSFVEDTILLDTLVIPRLKSQKLSEIILLQRHYADLCKQLDKSINGVGQRWTNSLQPWLLQHYSGTLNLRVERMLANCILENYTDFSSIDWPKLASRSEFAGH